MMVNLKWSKIINALPSGMTAQNNSALITTVFTLKRKALLTDLKNWFNTYQGISWTVEYQKCELPHCHILLFFTAQNHTLDSGWIDNYIQVKFPELTLNSDGKLTEMIKEIMMHSLCGKLNSASLCMKSDKYSCMICSKRYSQSLQPHTIVNKNEYSTYQWSENGHHVMKWVNGVEVAMFNEWVVLYSSFLIQKYHTHINIEVIETVQICKYIHKYIYKSEDHITLCFNEINLDEVAEHLNGHYIKLMQAAYQILKYSWYKEDSPVTILSIHFSDEQPVYYKENATSEKIQQVADQSSSTLMAFFKCCDENADAWQYLYHDFLVHYVYDKQSKLYSWKPWQCGRVIACMVHLSSIVGEKFYLHLLLKELESVESISWLGARISTNEEVFSEMWDCTT